jgi:hypothetical protein
MFETFNNLTADESIAYTRLQREQESFSKEEDASGKWASVYLDNAKPADWPGKKWSGVLGSLAKKGVYPGRRRICFWSDSYGPKQVIRFILGFSGQYLRTWMGAKQMKLPQGGCHRLMRYPEESKKENPLRVGTKHIRVKGVEYPFFAVWDHWRPALIHDSGLAWIQYQREDRVYHIFYATARVPYNRLPWTVDNARLCEISSEDCRRTEFDSLEKAIDVTMMIADILNEIVIDKGRITASELGYRGGIVRSERKSKAAQENGRKGGRKRLELNVDEI